MVNGSSPPGSVTPAGLWLPGEKADELAALNRSVIADRRNTAANAPPPSSFIMWLGQVADGFTVWGTGPKVRDEQLRQFWPTETFLAGAVGIVTARNAALNWQVTGSEQTAEASQEMLNNANLGLGWHDFIAKVSIDLYTQDSGAFVELIREFDSPEAAVIGINHLDAARCFPTGDPLFPVVYQDIMNRYHRMPWYTVVQLLELPSPKTFEQVGAFWRLQYCAVTRVLNAAQVLRDITRYKGEKIGGRDQRAVHLVSGFTTEQIRAAMTRDQAAADAAGLMRYVTPSVIGSMDPEARIASSTLELATLPDGFNSKEEIEAYILALSMGFLTDYQEFAPLPGGNLGTSSQSEILHMKSRGKGPGLFQGLILQLMNMHGVLPANVEFKWDEPDPEAEQQTAEVQKTRMETRDIGVRSGILTVRAAQQLALDDGDISLEVFESLGEDDEFGEPRRDITTDVSVEGEEQTAEGTDLTGMRMVSPDAVVIAHRRKARRPVTFGELITSRLHRAYATTADDASGLGYFDTIDDRLAVASAIGPALRLFEEELREAGVWDILVRPQDADRMVEVSMKHLRDGLKENPDRAGPDEAERLAFEGEVGAEIATALGDVRKRIAARLRLGDGAAEFGDAGPEARVADKRIVVKEIVRNRDGYTITEREAEASTP